MEQVLVGLFITALLTVCIYLFTDERLMARRIKNTQAHRLAAKEYIMLSFRFEGEDVVLMMTDKEFDNAQKRASENPEDVWKNK